MNVSISREIPEPAYQLGAVREDFRTSKATLALCMGTLVFVIGFIVWMGVSSFPGVLAPKEPADWVILIGTVVGMIGAAVWGVREIGQMVRNRHMRVVVFDDGFVSFRHDQVFVCRWDDVGWVCDQ